MELGSAIVANQTGDEKKALNHAKSAYLGFRHIENRAGSLRAQFEIVYALQFMSRSAECVLLAHRLASDSRKAGYSWLTAEAETEAGFCADMNGDLSGSAND